MNFTWLYAGALIASASATAQTTSEAPLPSEKEYFERAAEVQSCNGGEPTKLPELEALRTQTLDYYRTKLSKAGSDSDPASTSAIRALEANVVPTETLQRALSMKRIAADWVGWCRGVPSNIRLPRLAMTWRWPPSIGLVRSRSSKPGRLSPRLKCMRPMSWSCRRHRHPRRIHPARHRRSFVRRAKSMSCSGRGPWREPATERLRD